MKKILLIAILILGIVFYGAVSNFSVFGVFFTDGYVMTGNEVQTNLSESSETEVNTYSVSASDLIYQRMSTLYVGEEKKIRLNTDYPMYTNGGAAVRFLSNAASVIGTDFEVYSSYDGLVLNEGTAFNEDGTRSDWNEYIFAKLSNGLYVNSGVMYLENAWSSYVVPMNSCILFSEENGISYYSFRDGVLFPETITDIRANTLVRIGSLETTYRGLLLGLREIGDSQLSSGWTDQKDPVEIIEGNPETLPEIPEKTAPETEDVDEPGTADREITQVGGTSAYGQSPSVPVKPERPAAQETGDGTEETKPEVPSVNKTDESKNVQTVETDDNIASASEYLTDPADVMADIGDYGEGEYNPQPAVESAPPAQAAAPASRATKAEPPKPSRSSGKTDQSGNPGTGPQKIPDYVVPTVTAGSDYQEGIYTLKTSVTIKDPARVLVGGVTYEVTILDEYGAGTMYKRFSVKADGSNKPQAVIISGLKPESHYQITGTYKYKDEYGRITNEIKVFLEPREFHTKSVSELGPIYLEDMSLSTAQKRADSISVPVLKFTDKSDTDAVGSLAKITVRFGAGNGSESRFVNLTETQMEKVMAMQAISVSSAANLKSNTEYSVDVVCYDRFYNQLEVKNSHGVSSTCAAVPSAVIDVVPNDDMTTTCKVTIINPDELAYQNLKLQIRGADGQYVSLGANKYLSIKSGEPVTIGSLGSSISYTAVVLMKVDVKDGKGEVERIIGTKKFSTMDLSSYGPLFITAKNITNDYLNELISKTSDEKEKAALEDQKSTRAIFSLSLNDSTSEGLLKFIQNVREKKSKEETISFGIKLSGGDENISIELTEAQMDTLFSGKTLTLDTNDYTYDALSKTVAGLKSNTTYAVSMTAAYNRTNVDKNIKESVSIRVSTTLTKIKTAIRKAKIIIDPEVDVCYEGFIYMNIKIIDLDGIIGGDEALLKVDDLETTQLLGAFMIPKNSDEWYSLRLSSDASTSTGGLSYDIAADTTYRFSFIAEEAYPESGYTENYSLGKFTRKTGKSLTGRLYSLGMLEDRSNTDRYNASFGYTLDVPADVDGSLKSGTVYVDKIHVASGTETLEETIPLSYSGSVSMGTVWESESDFCDLSLTTAEAESSPEAVYVPVEKISGYTVLDYISLTAAQYIDTGIVPSLSTGIDVTFTGGIRGTGDCILMGAMSDITYYKSGANFVLAFYDSARKIRYGHGYGTSKIKDVALSPDLTYHAVYNMNGGGELVVNDKTLASGIVFDDVPGYSLYLGCANAQDNAKYFFRGNIYSCKIYDGPVLLRDYVPVRRSVDGSVGLYDKVSGDFYTSASTTAFLEGTEAEPYYLYTDLSDTHNSNQALLPDGYTAVDYLQGTGTQYIVLDPSINPSSGVMEYETRFNKLTALNGTSVLGSSNTASSIWSGLLYYTEYSTYGLYAGSSSNTKSVTAAYYEDHTAELTVNNNTKRWTMVSDGSASSGKFGSAVQNVPIGLFCRVKGSSGNIVEKFTGRIYYLRIYKDNELIADLLPCLDSSGVPGMYDTVAQRFYKNAGTGTFDYGLSHSHKLVQRLSHHDFETSVQKRNNVTNDSYIFRYYFKWVLPGTSVTVTVPLNSLKLNTDQEIYTISSGNEFIRKGGNTRRYVVVNDIRYDNSNRNSYRLDTLRADIDFQGFSFDTYVNFYPIVKTTTRTAKISNLVLNDHVPLNKSKATYNYNHNENNLNDTYVRTGGALFRAFYGTAENIYITYEQEEYPYTYGIGTKNCYWSDLSATELALIDQDFVANYRYGFLNRVATFSVFNYGTIDRFVVDLKTDILGETLVSGLCIYNNPGGSVSNGYLFSSTDPDRRAVIQSVWSYDEDSYRTNYTSGGGGIAVRTYAASTVSSVFVMADVVYEKPVSNWPTASGTAYWKRYGGIVGWNSEAAAAVEKSYLVGSVWSNSQSKPYAKTNGPVVGTTVNGSRESDLYYITDKSFGYTAESSTEVTYKALRSEVWQDKILNSEVQGFLVDSLIEVSCYPQVIWTSNCMPAQLLIPLTEMKKNQSSFDIAYSYTYSGGIVSIDQNPILGTIGNEAWDNTANDIPGYTQLSYIQSSGNQYIDTGYKISQEIYSITLDCEFPETFSGEAVLSGAEYHSGDVSQNTMGIKVTGVEGGSGKVMASCAGDTDKGNVSFTTGTRHVLQLGRNAEQSETEKFYFNVDSTRTEMKCSGTSAMNTPVYLFAGAVDEGGSVGVSAVKSSMKLYSATITEGGLTKMRLIPVRSNSTGEIGLYDTIGQKFYSNQGSGNFTAGTDSHYLDSQDQVVCIMIADSDATRVVYGIEIDGFNLTHSDVLYQYKDGSGINSVYVRVHEPEACLARYRIRSVTFSDDAGNPLPSQSLSGIRYANVKYWKRISSATGAYGSDSWEYLCAKYQGTNYPENIVLTHDLDFTGVSFDRIFFDGAFTADLNGRGHEIANIAYDDNLANTLGISDRLTGIGLMKSIQGSVSDLVLRSIHLEAGADVGILAANLSGARIDRVFVLDSYAGGGRVLGGMVGRSTGSSISNCGVSNTKVVHNNGASFAYNSGYNTNYANAAGLVGFLYSGNRVSHCFAQDVYIELLSADKSSYAGGLIAYLYGEGSSISGCYATGIINSAADYTGGLIGVLGSSVTDLSSIYSDVDIYCYNENCGGLVGYYYSSEVYENAGIAFGNISSSVLYDTADDRYTNRRFYGIRRLGNGTFSGALFSDARSYLGTELAGNRIIVGGGESGTTSVTDYTTGSNFTAGSTAMTAQNYYDGSSFDYLSADVYPASLFDFASGQLPLLTDTDGNLLAHQSPSYIGALSGSVGKGLTLDNGSFSLTDNGNDTYNLALVVNHSMDITVEQVYTDFRFVDDICGLTGEDTYESLTGNVNLSASSAPFVDRTVNGQTRIIINGLTPVSASDTYYITAIRYRQDGVTHYLRVGKILNIPQHWKEINSLGSYQMNVMGSFCENFVVTGDLDFTGSNISLDDGTANNLVNRMVGARGEGTSRLDYAGGTDNYYAIAGLTINDSAPSLTTPGVWTHYCSRGLISNVISEFGNFTVKDLNAQMRTTRAGLVGSCSGNVHNINFVNSTLKNTSTDRNDTGLFGLLADGAKEIYIENVTVTATGSDAGCLAGFARARSHNNSYLNITMKDCTVTGNSGFTGGFIGRADSYYDYETGTNLTVKNSSFTNVKVTGKGSYVGGICGYFYGTVYTMALENVSVVNTSAYTSPVMGGTRSAGFSAVTVNNSSARGTERIGGIVGYYEQSYIAVNGNQIITGCSVTNCTLTATGYNTTYDGFYRGACGGIMGWNYVSSISAKYIDNNTVRDCTITSAYGSSGGLVGLSVYYLYLNNNDVYDCTITSGANEAGGLVGGFYALGTYYSSVSRNYVQNCRISANQDYAGGISGNGSVPGVGNVVEDCLVVAGRYYAGGALGYSRNNPGYNGAAPNAASYSVSDNGTNAVIVRNCRIYARQYVGGGIGYVQSYSSYAATSAHAPVQILVSCCDIRGSEDVGGIAGYVFVGNVSYGAGYISGCYVGDSVISTLTSAIAGEVYNECGVPMTLYSGKHYGGLIGRGGVANNSMVENCVIGASSVSYAGGIEGNLCASWTSTVCSTASSNICKGCVVLGNEYVGGLYGQIKPGFRDMAANPSSYTSRITVADSYSDARVVGKNYVGGIAGLYGNSLGTFSRYNSNGVKDLTLANQYNLSASVQNTYFTGMLTAIGGNSNAGGVFGSVSIGTPFQDVPASVIGSADRSAMQRMVLNNVAILPSSVSAAVPCVLFPDSYGTTGYTLSDLAAENSVQHITLLEETNMIYAASSSNASVGYLLGSNPYSSWVGTAAEAHAHTDGKFIQPVQYTAADLTETYITNIYEQSFDSNGNMVFSADGSTPFGNITDISEMMPLVKFKYVGTSNAANGKNLFGAYITKSGTANPKDALSFLSAGSLSQGVYRPGTAAYTASRNAIDATYLAFISNGTISALETANELNNYLARKVSVTASAVDKIQIEFPADFFQGTTTAGTAYSISSASFSTKVNYTGAYSKIRTAVESGREIVPGQPNAYEYTYNFVDQLTLSIDYVQAGKNGTFSIIIDPEASTVGGISTRRSASVYGGSNYTLQSGRLYKDGTVFSGVDYSGVIPSGYQRVTSLSNKNSNKGAYIDTGVVLKQKPTILCTMASETADDTYQMGFANNSSGYNFQLDIKAGSKLWYKYGQSGWNINGIDISASSGTLGVIAKGTAYDWVFSDYISKSDGTNTYTSALAENWSFSGNTQSLRLFRGAGSASCTFYGAISIYDGDTLVSKLYPVVKTDGSNTYGMYDVVRNKFLPNAGTGKFTGGDPYSEQNLFIHLFDGKGLKSDGTIIDFSGLADNTMQPDAFRTARCPELTPAVLTATATISDGEGLSASALGSPLYTFNYNGTEIKTYGTCSVVGGKLSSDFLYYVKSGNLIIIDRNLNPVADGIFAYYEGGNSYIAVLTSSGQIVSLGTINLTSYLSGFRNSGITNLVSNINSSSHELIVSYSDGSMAGYDVLTGQSTFRTGGAEQPGIGEYLENFVKGLFEEVSEPIYSTPVVEAEAIIERMESTGETLADLGNKGIFENADNYGKFIEGGTESVFGEDPVTGETGEAKDQDGAAGTLVGDDYVQLADGTYVLASELKYFYEEGDPEGQEASPEIADGETWVIVSDKTTAAGDPSYSGTTGEAADPDKPAEGSIHFAKTPSKTGTSSDPAGAVTLPSAITAQEVKPSDMPGETGGETYTGGSTEFGTGQGGEVFETEDADADEDAENTSESPSMVDVTLVDSETAKEDEKTESSLMVKNETSYVAVLNAKTNSYDIYSVSELMENPETVKSESSAMSGSQAKFLLELLSAEEEESSPDGFSMYGAVIAAVLVLVCLSGFVLKKNAKRSKASDSAEELSCTETEKVLTS